MAYSTYHGWSGGDQGSGIAVAVHSAPDGEWRELGLRYVAREAATALARHEPLERHQEVHAPVERDGVKRCVRITLREDVDVEAAARKVAARRAQLESEIKRSEGMLANPGFVNKAPAPVVQAERESGPLAGVIVHLGGQTPPGLAAALERAGVPLVGTPPAAIHLAEDRGEFGRLLASIGLPAPRFGTATSFAQASRSAVPITGSTFANGSAAIPRSRINRSWSRVG